MRQSVLIGLSLILSVAGLAASGGQEIPAEPLNTSRASFSSDGSRLLVDLEPGLFEIDLVTCRLAPVRGGEEIYDGGYFGNTIVGCYVTPADRQVMFGSGTTDLRNPRQYSGILILEEGRIIGQFLRTGYCRSPVLDLVRKRVYCIMSVAPRDQIRNSLDFRYELFSSNWDGTDEIALTEAGRPINEFSGNPIGNQLVFSALSNASFENLRFRFGQITRQQLGKEFIPGELTNNLYSIDLSDLQNQSVVRLSKSFSDGELTSLVDLHSENVVSMRISYDAWGRSMCDIVSIGNDGSETVTGRFSLSLINRTGMKLRIQSLSEANNAIVFAVERSRDRYANPMERWLYLVNRDGTGLTEILLDLAKMSVRLRRAN